jgi:dienelactone hydrolase
MGRVQIIRAATVLLAGVVARPLGAAETAHPFTYEEKAPLDFRDAGQEAVDSATVHDVSYASPKGGRVPGYLVVPPGAGPFAGIVFVHWGQGDRTEFLSEAVGLAKAGVVSLMIDAPYHRPEAKSYKSVVEAEKERDEYVQLVVDARRAVDVLVSRPDVDKSRLGYVGHSLGATWGGPFAAVEKRVKAFVLMGGLPRLTDLLGDEPFAKMMQKAFTREQLESYIKVLAPIDPDRFVGGAEPESILFQFAKHDRFISEKAANDYVKAAGKPQQVRWYFTSHEFNDPQSPVDRREFLARKLGLKQGAEK